MSHSPTHHPRLTASRAGGMLDGEKRAGGMLDGEERLGGMLDGEERAGGILDGEKRLGGLLDGEERACGDDGFDRFARLAARLLSAPVAMVTLVEGDRQVIVAAAGAPDDVLPACSPCRRVVAENRPLVIDDVRDHPLARHGLTAYCGVPLSAAGEPVGTICAWRAGPHAWQPEDVAALADLAEALSARLALRRAKAEMVAERDRQAAVLRGALDAIVVMDEQGVIVEYNPAAEEIFGYPRERAIGAAMADLIVPERLRAAHAGAFTARVARGAGDRRALRVEVPALRADGSEFPAELSIAASPVGDRLLFTGFVRDLSEVRAAHQALRASEARYRALVENTPVVTYVADYDARNGLQYISPQIEAWTGYRAGRFTEEPEFWRKLVHPDDRARVSAQIDEMVRYELPFEAEYRLVAADGRILHVSEREVIIRDEHGRPVFSQGVIVDMTAQREAEAALAESRLRDARRIAQLAYEDALTGLPNRARLHERLDADLEEAAGARGRLALLYIDLDSFKLVNDALGHAAGDELLCLVVERVRAGVDDVGLLARYGGDELVLLLRGYAAAAADEVADGILAALSAPLALRGLEFEVSASIGIAYYPEHGETREQLLDRADAAMYQAKRAGRGRVQEYRAADAQAARGSGAPS